MSPNVIIRVTCNYLIINTCFLMLVFSTVCIARRCCIMVDRNGEINTCARNCSLQRRGKLGRRYSARQNDYYVTQSPREL